MIAVRALGLAVALAGCAGAARADCLSVFQLEQVVPGAATVMTEAAQIHFASGEEVTGCPADTAACRDRAYVVSGDTVAVVGVQGQYSCALLTNAKGVGTEGWLPTAALLPVAGVTPSLDAWIGHWRTGDQSLTISAASTGRLKVHGEATFGSHDPERVRRGAVNLGDVAGSVAPQDNLLALTEGDNGKTLPFSDADPYACRIRMQLVGPYLWAWENGCGGMGVSFIGLYARSGR